MVAKIICLLQVKLLCMLLLREGVWTLLNCWSRKEQMCKLKPAVHFSRMTGDWAFILVGDVYFFASFSDLFLLGHI